ncbi:MAG: DNA polymerase III subunit delta [Balneolaceae bacterium]
MAKTTGIDVFRQAWQSLKKQDQLKPVYYLNGEESFFIDLLQDEFEKIVPDDQKDFNFDLIYGADSSPAQVLDIVRSYPMMAERRVVIVRDFLKLAENTEDGELNDFTGYFNQPNESAILCLIDKKLPDGRSATGKFLKGTSTHHQCYTFDTLPDYKIPDWVIDWTRHSHNRKIDAAAAQMLSQLAGQDLKLLSTEIEKLCTFVDNGENITAEHVKKITGSYRDYTVFELKDAIINRNLDQALGISEQMLLKTNYNAGEVMKTVGFFYNVFGNIWQICRLSEKGLNKQQVQDSLDIKNSYIFNLQWKEASQFRLAEMPGIFEALLDTDRSLKGFSTLDTSYIFLLLVKRIIG